MPRNGISIALPSKDMQKQTVELFKDTRIGIRADSERNSHVTFSGFTGLKGGSFMRSTDVAEFVAGGQYDVGITTDEVIAEHSRTLKILAPLGFSRNGRGTKKGGFAHKSSGIRCLADIPRGARVRTEFPRLTKAFFRKHKMLRKVKLVASRGSTETHVPYPYQLGVCLMDSGQSLQEHGHRVVAVLMMSDTVFVANKAAYRDPAKREVIEDLLALLMGTVNGRSMRVLKMNVPVAALPKIRKILPRRQGQSPTINRLDDGSMVAVEYVVYINEINELKPRLKRAGATFILVGKEESIIP